MFQRTFQNLIPAIRLRVKGSLQQYPIKVPEVLEDVTNDVLLKLVAGDFLKSFDPTIGYPRPYLLGSARQYTRTIARSLWRQHRRDRGLPPYKPHSEPFSAESPEFESKFDALPEPPPDDENDTGQPDRDAA